MNAKKLLFENSFVTGNFFQKQHYWMKNSQKTALVCILLSVVKYQLMHFQLAGIRGFACVISKAMLLRKYIFTEIEQKKEEMITNCMQTLGQLDMLSLPLMIPWANWKNIFNYNTKCDKYFFLWQTFIYSIYPWNDTLLVASRYFHWFFGTLSKKIYSHQLS